MGSLFCAVASYLDCRANGGTWLIRIEDVDTVREVDGAREQIIACLSANGMESDHEFMIHSERNLHYQAALDQLREKKHCYPCTCSRKQLADFVVYPGFCRDHSDIPQSEHAWRIRTEACDIAFKDAFQGDIHQQLEASGDFVLQRKDKLWAYHLAVVVDDADQGVNRILRGIDLLECCAPQIYLQRVLQLPQPDYAHVPVLVNAQGQKLSKQTYASAVDHSTAKTNLLQVLALLQQKPVPPASRRSIADILDFATINWDTGALQGQKTIAAP
jgi:glutamyl-Q tRNA(Asp) synthetase